MRQEKAVTPETPTTEDATASANQARNDAAVEVGVSYDADLDRTREVLSEAAREV